MSFAHRHLAAITYELSAEDAKADVVISSELRHQQPLPVDSSDPRLAVGFVGRVLHPRGTFREGMRVGPSYATDSSRLILGCGMDHVLEAPPSFTRARYARMIWPLSHSGGTCAQGSHFV